MVVDLGIVEELLFGASATTFQPTATLHSRYKWDGLIYLGPKIETTTQPTSSHLLIISHTSDHATWRR